MNPKEKARELVERFTSTCRECDYERNAIMFALIAVNEIIKAMDEEFSVSTYFWQEVKQEIEKL